MQRQTTRGPRALPWLASLLAVAICCTLAAVGAAQAQSNSLSIVNYSYLDSFSKTMVPGTRMVIEDGKIAALDDPSYSCSSCQEIDLAGGFIIPGLIDLHQHLGKGGFGELSLDGRVQLFRSNLHWGITAAFNPSLPADAMAALRLAVNQAPDRFPRFLTAGRMIGPKDGWADFETATVGGLKAAIDAQIAAGVTAVNLSFDNKVWLSGNPLPVFSEDAMRAAIDHAHKRERRVFVHTTQAELAKKAVRAGADMISTGLVYGAVDSELISLVKRQGTGFVATLSAFAAIADNAKSAERQRGFDPDLVNGSGIYQSLGSPIMAQNWRDWWPLSYAVPERMRLLAANMRELIDAGITVGIGTDAGTPGVVFGASLADELKLHVELLGMRPVDALVMASLDNARILYLSEMTGTIEVGKSADLVLMQQDPTVSIDALNSILYTVRGGRLHDRRDF